MLLEILKKLADVFLKNDYQSRLEQYIISRYPQNTADVEMFTREYNQRQGGWL